jgi:phosphoadenosine phosphosulfate reductase
MTLRDDIRSVSVHLDTPGLLRYLIKERFPGTTVVTASLRARSIVVLKMISEIDPATPVIFCHRSPFEESIEYRARIVKILGLTNVSSTEGHETSVKPGDVDHYERMWINYQNMPGRSCQLLHLNDCLSPYSCWISAVYHEAKPDFIKNRVDVEGRLIRVDPLVRWSQDEVREFMRNHGLPYHKRAAREFNYEGNPEGSTNQSYHF